MRERDTYTENARRSQAGSCAVVGCESDSATLRVESRLCNVLPFANIDRAIAVAREAVTEHVVRRRVVHPVLVPCAPIRMDAGQQRVSRRRACGVGAEKRGERSAGLHEPIDRGRDTTGEARRASVVDGCVWWSGGVAVDRRSDEVRMVRVDGPQGELISQEKEDVG